MAKLEGVKVIDMTDGVPEKIEYGGQEYVKVDGDPRVGDIVRALIGGKDITKGAFYKAIRIDSEGDARFSDDVNDRDGGLRSQHCEIFRPTSATLELTFEGKTYRKVDRKPKSGDYIVFEYAPERWLTAGKPYKVEYIDGHDDAQILDNDGDSYDTYGSSFDVYELVSEPPTQTIEITYADGTKDTLTGITSVTITTKGAE